MPTQSQLVALERVAVELHNAKMYLESLDKELSHLTAGTKHHSLMSKLRNRQYAELGKITERYRDLKNLADLCFDYGCNNPITYSAYCDKHRPLATRGGS